MAEVEQRLRPEVVRILHYLADDATGDPAVFFLVLLSDEASRYEVLRNNTRRIEEEIEQTVRPLWTWEVFPYFHYRSESAQAQLKSQAWAA